ncbi:DUF2029 domain-containing protein [Candidatus Sumerlaeota bacterium]|nr:DUF2029 domain-containing protein [Candidatus Sumerlaeota bacterium]
MSDHAAQSSPSSIETTRRFVVLTLWWMVAGVFVALALHNSIYNVLYLRYHDDTSYPECAVVERTLAVAHGQPLYGDTRSWPYNVAMYGPLTYYPVAWAVRLAGAQDRYGEARTAYVVGRSISLVAGFAVGVWLWLMAGKIGLSGAWRWWPAALVLGVRPMTEFWPSFRPDLPVAALCLWAWVGVLRSRRWGPVVFAALPISIAAAYKHTAAVSAAALFVWLLADRRRAHAWGFAGIVALLVGAQTAFLYVSTDGRWFENTVGSLRSAARFANAYEVLFPLPPLALLPLAAGFAALLGVDSDNERLRPARWAFAVQIVGTLLLSVRTGSKAYYYLEAYCWGALILTSLAARSVYPSIRDLRAGRSAVGAAWFLLLCLLAVPALSQWVSLLRSDPPPKGRTWDERYADLTRILKRTRGPVFLSVGYPYWLTQSPPTLMDVYLFSARAAVGGVPVEDLVGRVDRREFEIVILNWHYSQPGPRYLGLDGMPRPVIDAIVANYLFAGRYENYYLYTPRPLGNFLR